MYQESLINEEGDPTSATAAAVATEVVILKS
jgi:hypothetical protein